MSFALSNIQVLRSRRCQTGQSSKCRAGVDFFKSEKSWSNLWAQFGVEFYMLCSDHFQLNFLLEPLEKLLTVIVLSLQCSNTSLPFWLKVENMNHWIIFTFVDNSSFAEIDFICQDGQLKPSSNLCHPYHSSQVQLHWGSQGQYILKENDCFP